MSEHRPAYEVLTTCDTLDAKPPDIIQVSRSELEQERRHLLGRLQWLHRILGYPPLLTGKEQRRQAFTE